ncbi:hypothetical protein GQ457_12G014120 [Hibiscus cannabinus]
MSQANVLTGGLCYCEIMGRSIESNHEDDIQDPIRVEDDEDDDDVQTFATGEALIVKRSMRMTKHPNPYRLQWLNDGGEVRVMKQALVPFTIGKYKDEVLCDVVTMDACHLLLGRPWQFDKGTTHDGTTNRYSFMHAGKKITLAPLTPSQVQEDHIRLRKNVEEIQGKKKMNIYASNKDIRKYLSSQLSLLVVLYKDNCLSGNVFPLTLYDRCLKNLDSLNNNSRTQSIRKD